MALGIEKSTRKVAFMEGKPTVHTYKKVRYQNITFEMLVEEIAQTQGVNKTMAKAVVEAYINRLIHYMELGLGVQMGDFGIFKPTIRTKTTATEDELDTNHIVGKRIQFLPGKAFRQMLKNLNVITLGEDDDENDGNGGSNGSNGQSGVNGQTDQPNNSTTTDESDVDESDGAPDNGGNGGSGFD